MPIKIVDASAIAAIVFAEPDGHAMAVRLAASHLLAPTIFGYELANIYLLKLRRFPDLAKITVARYADLHLLEVREQQIDIIGALAVARRFQLTAYDASYLWLARYCDAELVTLDKQLARAAAAS